MNYESSENELKNQLEMNYELNENELKVKWK
jgi:hypothetical protein